MHDDELQVRFVPERRRFEARHPDDDEVAFLDVMPAPIWTLGHTEVPAAHEGKGVGTALVRAALAHVRGEGATIMPLCPFVLAYLRRHPEEADVVHERFRYMVQGAGR